MLITSCAIGLKENYSTVNNKPDEIIEYLDWEALKINNRLPLLCSPEELITLLGKPDSVVTPNMDEICTSYFEGDFKYYYFGGSQFEVSKEKAALSSIDFEADKKIKLNFGELVLDNSLTLERLAAIFPKATKDRYEVELDKKGKYICVKLAASKKMIDNAWLLFFKNEKLVRMDYWMPC